MAEKTSLSVDIDKELLLKFKSMCVLREHTMSEEIETMVRDWVDLNQDEKAESSSPEKQSSGDTPKAPAKASGDLSDQLEQASETG